MLLVHCSGTGWRLCGKSEAHIGVGWNILQASSLLLDHLASDRHDCDGLLDRLVLLAGGGEGGLMRCGMKVRQRRLLLLLLLLLLVHALSTNCVQSDRIVEAS